MEEDDEVGAAAAGRVALHGTGGALVVGADVVEGVADGCEPCHGLRPPLESLVDHTDYVVVEFDTTANKSQEPLPRSHFSVTVAAHQSS